MAKNTAPKKKYNPNKKPSKFYGFSEKIIHISVDDLEAVASEIYSRLPPFRAGKATFSDRTTFLVRIQAGINMLEHFEESEVRTILEEGQRLLTDCRDKKNKCIRPFTEDEYIILTMCISMVHRMARACTVWQQALATKAAEDKYLIGSSDYEYVFKSVVN